MPHSPNSSSSPSRRSDRLLQGARAALSSTLNSALAAYDRRNFLRCFHRLSGETIAAETPEACRLVLHEIERALRGERARAGHWTYDLDRHIGLVVAYRAEQARAERIARHARRRRP
ncbi:hypothetical protein [Methylosinus sp. Sm6]|uniref:hypothetical protein n=1 Tax=Methylosinus sp. Sm6 TaxID=2866948 RepID=UPI001C9918BD|nr:hypothetical protein [Methylosinus sp. Sm6]MBY6241677.1 hypothetical protein [Methylosinus sp. Sm6]